MKRIGWWVCLSVLIAIGTGCASDGGSGEVGGDGGMGAEAGASGSDAAGAGATGGSQEGSAGTAGSNAGGTGGGSDADSGEDGSTSPDADGGTGVDAGTDAETVEIVGAVPDTDYCRPFSAWDPDWSSQEEEALDRINQQRAQGANCGTEGSFEPAAPLRMDPFLRCSARQHSMDMVQQGYFDSQSPDGRIFMQRINDAGYHGVNYSENIGTGYAAPTALIDALMGSDGVCANLMNPAFDDAAVGFYQPESPDGSTYANSRMWTVDVCASGASL